MSADRHRTEMSSEEEVSDDRPAVLRRRTLTGGEVRMEGGETNCLYRYGLLWGQWTGS